MDATAETENKQEVESLKLDDLTAEQVLEFLDGWEHAEGKELKFAKSIYGTKWEFAIDKRDKTVRLSSDKQDLIQSPRSNETRLEHVILNRRNGYIRFQSGSCSYEISSKGNAHGANFPDLGRVNLNLIPPLSS